MAPTAVRSAVIAPADVPMTRPTWCSRAVQRLERTGEAGALRAAALEDPRRTSPSSTSFPADRSPPGGSRRGSAAQFLLRDRPQRRPAAVPAVSGLRPGDAG